MTSPFGNYPDNYLLFNQKQSKLLAIVLEIEGLDTLFGIADTFTKIRYGDAGIVYGLPGVVYGGLRRINQVKPYMQLDSGLVISQRIEPEQGKGNLGTITVNLIDYNGDVSSLFTPGQALDEILAGKLCRLYVGFADTSFPEDYVLIYQGYVTQIYFPPGLVRLQISDSTMKNRQPIFSFSNTTVQSPIPATGAVSGDIITVFNTGALAKQILGPDGTYDPTVSTYMVVDNEIMQYSATGILSDTQVLCTRAALGSQISAHDAGSSAKGSVGFGFNAGGINAIDFALKTMLSGFGAPSVTAGVLSFVYDYQGNFVSNEFVLSTKDAILDLGLTVGDYFYISNSASGNNLSGLITGILPGANDRNTIIQTNQVFTLENPTAASAAFRSQYDTFPVSCGVGCRMADVDVSTFQSIKKSYFSSGIYNLRAYYDSPILGKDLVDKDILLPIGSYSISRYGRISMSVTKPPLPGNGTKILELNYTNILDPDKITVSRATNQRSFYNQISYQFNYDIVNKQFSNVQYFLDTTSITKFDFTSELPIAAKAVSAQLGGATLAQQRGEALLTRFKNCLTVVELTVNWSVGSLLEVSDIVLLRDQGNLKIMNFETGKRDLGVELYEVIDRNYSIVAGNVKLKLLGGLGFSVNSRYGLISPSSTLSTGSTSSTLKLSPSWGQTNVQSEYAKWRPLTGFPVLVHSYDWSVTGSSTFIGANAMDPFAMDLSPPLAFAPPSGYIVDIASYPTNTDKTRDQLLKLLYAHYTPTILVTSGVSNTKFNVAASGAPLLTVGNTVILRNSDYSTQSDEIAVESVSGTLVTLVSSLGFTPDNTFVVEGIGFKDGNGFYRYT